MSLMKKAIGGSIHRIREFELEKVNLADEFDILQIVGEGWFGKILLTEHRSTQTEMVLKALPKAYTGISDFFREFHYGLHLSAHRNIITTYDVAFETAGFYIFSQEYAPLGDLTSNVSETGLGELHAKRVARQLAAAVHHIHSRELVHRDIKLDNILVFRSDFSRIKLCDFGETRRVNTVVRRHNEWLPYSPPEVLHIDTDVTYKAVRAHDVWQFGIVLFVCLTGCLPWQKAALDDPRYSRYLNWHTATLNIAKKPKLFQLISSKAQRMFKRLLDPKGEKRPTSVLEVNKYHEDRWLAKLGAEKALTGGADERDELCPSMYSFHSSLEEKNQLLYTLTTYGIETTVDRSRKKDRIREWIESSAIAEENEEEGESDLNEQDVLEACLEDGDEDEPISMKGRHFPERRPSAPPIETTEGRRKKRHSSHHPRKRQQAKTTRSVETKSPFAPQVAAERETVARLGSFPNGDPSLAVAVTNGTGSHENSLERSGSLDSAAQTMTKIEHALEDAGPHSSSSGQSLRNSAGSSANTSLDSFVHVAAAARSNAAAGSPVNGRKPEDGSAVESPPVPDRKHRSQTLPPPPPPPPPPSGSTSSPPRSSVRAETLPNQTSAIKADVRADESSTELGESRYKVRGDGAENCRTNTAAGRGNEKSSPPRTEIPPASGAVQGPSNALTSMPVTSHLVLQSFNALQDVNSAMINNQGSSANAPPASDSPSNSLANLRPNSPRNSPAKSTAATKPHRRNDGAPIMSYGKDALEHYGIAQGVIFRTESVKHRGGHLNGTSSRSVSN